MTLQLQRRNHRSETMRAFALGLGIGALLCVVAAALIYVGVSDLSKESGVPLSESPVNSFQSPSEQLTTEYSVIVKIKLSDGDMGTETEIEAGFELEERLVELFASQSELGEFDGDGFGVGYFDMYMYTTSPDNLVAQILPLIRETDPPAGSYIVTKVTETGADEKRYEL